MAATEASPYTLDEPPPSTGRALLSRAFSDGCALHLGVSAEEIAAAFDPATEIEPNVRPATRMAARLIGELVAFEKLKTVARPIGGGKPVELDAEDGSSTTSGCLPSKRYFSGRPSRRRAGGRPSQ